MSPRVDRPASRRAEDVGLRAPAPAATRVLLLLVGLALLSGGAAADELDAAAGDTAAPATTSAEAADDLDLPPLSLPKPLAVRPIAPSDLPPPNVFARRSQPLGPGVHFNMAPGHLDHRDHGAYRAIIEREAAASGVPPELADAVMAVESSYNPATVGADGEIGLMQVMPGTARMLGFTGSMAEFAVPEINIHYGVTYLAAAWRLARQDICTAAMKYRAGLGEARFSVLSVNYCIRVRAHLAARGVVVTGTVPEPTFGQLFAVSATHRRSVLGRGAGTVNFAALNAKLRDLTDRIALRSLR
jgi:soluble lytic murein transglycosylase-like protein